jgi:hypothetical protein
VAAECFDLTSKAAAFVALHDADDFGEFGLIPGLPGIQLLRPSARANFFPLLPVVHVEPLDVADAGGRLHLGLALDEDGLDVPALHADGDGDFIKADAGVAGGMLREEGQHAVAAGDAVGDISPPIVAGLDLVLVEPDIVSTFFEVGLDVADEFLVGVVAIAEEDAKGRDRLFGQHMPTIFADMNAALLTENDVLRLAVGAVDVHRRDSSINT